MLNTQAKESGLRSKSVQFSVKTNIIIYSVDIPRRYNFDSCINIEKFPFSSFYEVFFGVGYRVSG